jgi:dihydrofolate synthase/folylpolyglutamate synthase
MNYNAALKHLFSINNGMKLGTSTMGELLKDLGHPEKTFRSIHIAGTNGKGSVSTKIAKALSLAGCKTGLYTSPHISSFRERIQINGEFISEDQVASHLQEILKLAVQPTFFETTTLLAFLHFANEKVDYAVIETGIGGRKDATNTLTPELSIITSIGFDHMEILGDTLEKIAFEKAGIIKEGIPVFIGPNVPKKEIETVATPNKAPLTQVSGSFSTFDEENNAIAKAALDHLGIDKSSIQTGCLARPPCRIEVVNKDFPIILDVAHNPDGLRALFKSLEHLYPHQKFACIAGFSDSKDIDGCLEILSQNASYIYLVQAKHRGTPTAILAKKLNALKFIHYSMALSIQKVLEKNIGPLLICGTFFIMNEVRKTLGLQFPQDPEELNERVR